MACVHAQSKPPWAERERESANRGGQREETGMPQGRGTLGAHRSLLPLSIKCRARERVAFFLHFLTELHRGTIKRCTIVSTAEGSEQMVLAHQLHKTCIKIDTYIYTPVYI